MLMFVSTLTYTSVFYFSDEELVNASKADNSLNCLSSVIGAAAAQQ